MAGDESLKVLVVDDDDEVREIIQSNLKVFGFNSKAANSVNSALDFLKNDDFGIVITDIKMPGEDGVKLLREIKKKDVNKPAVYLVSAFSEYSNEELYHIGADGFFPKPFSASLIRDSVIKARKSKKELWSSPITSTQFHIKKKVESLEKSDEIELGRGGFRLTNLDHWPSLNQFCNFEIEIAGGKPVNSLIGEGKVLWVRPETEEGLVAAVGIEIQYLHGDCMDPMLIYIGNLNTPSYIPQGL